MSYTPFKIDVAQGRIDRLKQKLAATDFPDELQGAGWDYGAPLDDIKRLVKYWHDEFDWRKAEAELNELPQFRTTITLDGFKPIDLHFVYVKSTKPNAIPLLFAHGWPGSFDEVSKILKPLLDGGDESPSFDVVAPSMPNYGFSSAVEKGGFGSLQTGQVFHKLMTEVLGYPQYVTQGGDVGYAVTRHMGFLYPQQCRASHYNFPRPEQPSQEKFPELYKKDQQTPRTQAEKEAQKRLEWFNSEGSAYSAQHGTKPQTLGYGLTDSPVGLLAWIYEKLHDWTDAYPWTDYEVCKWISIYWFSTAGPLASLRLYYDSRHMDSSLRQRAICGYMPDEVKIGCSKFPKELLSYPKLWNYTLGNLVFNAEHESGGHFAATEKPDVLVGDLRTMFGRNGGAYGVVEGRSGYA